MLKIGIVGVGGHARDHHLPSLARYAEQNPGAIQLQSLCDLDAGRLRTIAQQYGVEQTYTDMDAMLAQEHLDALMLLTPPSVTWQVTQRALAAGIPLLIEKPPGADLAEAQALASAVCASRVPAMVSVNRRFDPIIAEGARWLAGRKVDAIHCRFARVNRREQGFFTDTAIHACDTVRFLAGERPIVRRHVSAPTGDCRIAHIEFEGGLTATLEILPTSGANAECYTAIGDGFTVTMQSPFFDAGDLRCWEGGRVVHALNVPASEPAFIRSGTFAETCAFIEALRAEQALAPGPDRVVGSVELAWKIAEASGRIPAK